VGAVGETPVGLTLTDRRWPLIAATCGPTVARRAFHVRFLINSFPTLQTGVNRRPPKHIRERERQREKTNRDPNSGVRGGVGDAGSQGIGRDAPCSGEILGGDVECVHTLLGGFTGPYRGVVQVAVCDRPERSDPSVTF
jgi:hypothetical protein